MSTKASCAWLVFLSLGCAFGAHESGMHDTSHAAACVAGVWLALLLIEASHADA